MADRTTPTREDVRRALATTGPASPNAHAAVLVPLFTREGRTHVLLTKRTETVGTHRGQISFPGGMTEPGDADPVATALRETREEVGILPADVDVLGRLEDVTTGLGLLVTPVVGWIPHPYTYIPNRSEVAAVMEVPWAAFASPPRAKTLLGEGFRRLALGFEVDGQFVWGATARMVRALRATLEKVAEPS